MTNEQDYDSIEPMEKTKVALDHLIQDNPIGEARKDALRLVFNRKLKLEFSHSHKSVVSQVVREG